MEPRAAYVVTPGQRLEDERGLTQAAWVRMEARLRQLAKQGGRVLIDFDAGTLQQLGKKELLHGEKTGL